MISRGVGTRQINNAFQSRSAVYCSQRAFSVSCGTQAPRLKEKRKDTNLRHAINLYHLTDFFFPTNTEVDSGKGKMDHEAYDKELDHHIRFSIMGSSTTRSYGQHNNMNGTVEMRGSHPTLAKKNKEDEIGFDSIFTNSKATLEGSLRDLKESARYMKKARAEDTLPPAEDQEAVELFVAESARRDFAFLQLPDSRAADNFDIRGAQVRDALFGTVGGVRPGLEALRERVKEKKARAQQKEQGNTEQEVTRH
jgi:hypothetical protein